MIIYKIMSYDYENTLCTLSTLLTLQTSLLILKVTLHTKNRLLENKFKLNVVQRLIQVNGKGGQVNGEVKLN